MNIAAVRTKQKKWWKTANAMSVTHTHTETNVPLSELVNIQRARESEIARMLMMGLQDVWRRVHPEPEVAEEVGPTRGDRRIDRILLPPCVSEHIQSVSPRRSAGRAIERWWLDWHRRPIARSPTYGNFLPTCWGREFQEEMQEVFVTSQHLRGVQWWDRVSSQARQLAQQLDKQTRGWNQGVLPMQWALATSPPTCLSSVAEQILQDSDVSYDMAQ